MSTTWMQVGMHVMQSDIHLTENGPGTIIYVAPPREDSTLHECIVRWHELYKGKHVNEVWVEEDELVEAPAVAPAWVNAKY